MLQKDVLAYLEQNRGKVITGGQLSLKFGVSRTAIWKAIHVLQDKGHEIISLPNSGYQLLDTSDGLSEQTITDLLTTQELGRPLEIHETLNSTNSYLKNLNLSELQEGYTVIADEQTSGRGRLGRTFASLAKEGIYLSVLLKPDIALQNISTLTICAAVAVCRAVERVCGITAGVKWVNDIFINGKKLCGILTEATVSAELQKVESVVVGIGINTGTIDESVKDIAASILQETGQKGLRNRLIAEVLNQLEEVYFDFTGRQEKDQVLAEYSEKLLFIGKQVTIKEIDKSYVATVLGVDETGALRVVLPNGEAGRVLSGEIVI